MPEPELTYESFVEMLLEAKERGWVSNVVCATHDGIPGTDEENKVWEEGGDPCTPVIRLWEPTDMSKDPT